MLPGNSNENSFRDWLDRFEKGDGSAADEVVGVYYERLVRLAQRRLSNLPPQIADDEGAVISALRSFFSGVQSGQFSKVKEQEDLWRILATITARKAIRQLRSHWKQSGERQRVNRENDVKYLLSRNPSPEDEAMMIDQCQARLDSLGDPTLQKIACMRLEGFSTQEIADRLAVHVRSVQRKLKLIETKWLESD
jgi:DNA-directed RNA polymerase specialized sigma24 family protein